MPEVTPTITPRERDVLQILHSGVARTNREYGALLHISSKSIEAVLSNLYRKFEVSCLAHLLLKTIPSTAQPQAVGPTLRISDVRFIKGKTYIVKGYGADGSGFPCVMLQCGEVLLAVPITVTVAFDALVNAA